ncbi:hypothetical protein [Wenxinia marina]|uniref:hypothetical protein n=1 Tax=Wenxinia marina TaxID=390641 RepID=UPI00037C2560|nr:hypothetical protein [Wenxinia marina]GGL55773.1 hypothetical protein GCM10011392_07760 [Wenxinia marina]
MPTRSELRELDEAIKFWLGNALSTDEQISSFKKLWGTAVRRLHKPPSMARGYTFLEGDTGLSQAERGDIILANYQHRQGHSLSDAMVRWMSCRLWAETLFQMPAGKKHRDKELDKFVNRYAGQFVVARAGISKTVPPIIRGEDERVYRLSIGKTANVSRAIGAALGDAVSYAMGKTWHHNEDLARATDAILLAAIERRKK